VYIKEKTTEKAL